MRYKIVETDAGFRVRDTKYLPGPRFRAASQGYLFADAYGLAEWLVARDAGYPRLLALEQWPSESYVPTPCSACQGATWSHRTGADHFER